MLGWCAKAMDSKNENAMDIKLLPRVIRMMVGRLEEEAGVRIASGHKGKQRGRAKSPGSEET